MKEIKNKLQQVIKNIKTFFINKLCVSLKKKTNIVATEEKFSKFTKLLNCVFKKHHDTRILKSMDEYKIGFELDDKIAQNRHRLRELFEMYKKIENYYPFFIGLFAFFGVYSFDFITSIFLFNTFNCVEIIFSILTIIYIIFLIYLIIEFYNLFKLSNWLNDSLPKDVYKFVDGTNETEVKEKYLESLEKSVISNLDLYSKRKMKVDKLIKMCFFIFLIYSLNIIYHKTLFKMAENDKEKIEIVINPIITKEDEKQKTDKPLITEQDEQSKYILTFQDFLNLPDTSPHKIILKKYIKTTIEEYFEENKIFKKEIKK